MVKEKSVLKERSGEALFTPVSPHSYHPSWKPTNTIAEIHLIVSNDLAGSCSASLIITGITCPINEELGWQGLSPSIPSLFLETLHAVELSYQVRRHRGRWRWKCGGRPGVVRDCGLTERSCNRQNMVIVWTLWPQPYPNTLSKI